MKEKSVKKALVLLAATLAATAAMAQTNQVLSRNAVGYVNVYVQSNGLSLVRIPFNQLTPTNMSGVMGTQLTGNNNPSLADQILKWDASSQAYVTYFKHGSGTWRKVGDIVETTNTLSPGESFWIRNRRTFNTNVYLMGEVPDAVTAPTFTNVVLVGLNLVSPPYPITYAITNLALYAGAVKNNNPSLADQLLRFDSVGQAYVTYFAHAGGGDWRKVGELVTTTDSIQAGEGLWYRRRTSNTNWVAIKPYTWP